MDNVTLPVGIQTDIEDTFCFSQERGYQDRCHEYIDRYEVPRPWRRGNTAVQSVVEHLCRRAFLAGSQMTCADKPEPGEAPKRRGSRWETGQAYQSKLEDFVESGEGSRCVALDSDYDANLFSNGVRGRARTMGVPVIVMKRGSSVYLIREES